MEVRPSSIKDAGDGLWATKDIEVGSVFDILHSKRAASPHHPTGDVIDGFVRSNHDPTTVCLCDGAITPLSASSITPRMRTPQYFYVDREELLMKANDFGWNDSVRSEAHYERNAQRNQLDLIMKVERGRVVGVCGVTRRSIANGDEIGITYGYGYWV